MRKVIAGINSTIDGFCDHTVLLADEEIHQHYTNVLTNADAILYGRITYQLMQYWQNLLKNPSGEKSMDDFALAIDKIPKIVFSHTLKNTEWDSAELASQPVEEVVTELKQQPGRDILIGSRSLIVELTNLNLIDEYQLCIHPVIVGKGLPLFENLTDRTVFKLLKTKNFKSGAIIHYYENKNKAMAKSKLIRMDNVGIVVESLDETIAFFAELGLKLEGRATIEGEWAGRVTGLGNQQVEIAMMVTPDGHSRLELSRFLTPPVIGDHRNAPVNSLGYLRVMFAVDNIDEMLVRLQKIGARLVGDVVKYEDLYRLCYIRGPEGILIGLAEQLTKNRNPL
jgi:dihydrofolate reductase/catechol 2,3-dioxygenase-like lactoylglutathione lyase family enzyme